MAEKLSGIEQSIFDLTKVGCISSLVSGVSSGFWDSDFKYTLGLIIATSAVAGLGLLTELSRRAYEESNQKLSNYNWRIK
jgi:hypothetical protein